LHPGSKIVEAATATNDGDGNDAYAKSKRG